MSKLKRFNKSNGKNNTIKLIVAFLLVAVMSAAISYAVYQKEDEVLFINARVGEFETTSSDIELAMTLDGEDIDVPPSKGYYNVTVECDHADGEWDEEKWGAIITNISSNRVKCNINFDSYEKTINDVEIGDYISMIPTSTSYTLPNDLSGCDGTSSTCIQNEINPSELNLWRVIKKNDDGTVEVVSEYVSSNTVWFYGLVGYANFVKGLNFIANQYSNEKYVQSTRHIGYSNQTEIITNTTKLNQGPSPWDKSTSLIDQWSNCNINSYLCGTEESLGAGDIGYEADYNLIYSVYKTMKVTDQKGETSTYWLSSRLYQYYDINNWYTYGRYVSNDGSLSGQFLWYYWEKKLLNRPASSSVRPILTLKSNITIKSGDGKSANTSYYLY